MQLPFIQVVFQQNSRVMRINSTPMTQAMVAAKEQGMDTARHMLASYKTSAFAIKDCINVPVSIPS